MHVFQKAGRMIKSTIESICDSIHIEWSCAHDVDQYQRFRRVAAMINGINNMLIYHDLDAHDELKEDLRLLWNIAHYHSTHY